MNDVQQISFAGVSQIMMDSNVSDVFRRYKRLYVETADAVVEVYSSIEGLSISLTSHEDLEAAKSWRNGIDYNGVTRVPPYGGWDWHQLFDGYKSSAKRFIVSLKVNGVLCTLFSGGVSDGKVVTKLHYIESSIERNPLSQSQLDISVMYISTLGGLVGSQYISIYEPSDKVRNIAMTDYGFTDANPFGMPNGTALYASLTGEDD